MRTATWLVLLSASAVSAPAASPLLTLDQALATAREHQPQILEAQATAQAARARADQARASLLPQLNGQASYSRSTANFVARPGSLPRNLTQGTTSSQWTTYGFYNFGVSADQLLWDFGATPDRWRAARESAASQQEAERSTFLQAMDAVRQAFFTARANRGLVTVAQETLANQDRHLKQVEAFVEVGTQPEIALAQSRADRANAQVQLITAQNNYETAKAQLNQAMGVEQSTDYDVADDAFPAVPGEDEGTEALLSEALATRPDLAAATRTVHAQELTVRSMRGSFWPSLSASTGFTEAGGTLDAMAWNWNAALSLSVPLFRGGLTRAQLTEAEATLRALTAQAEVVRQQIRLDIEQARLAVKAARAALDASGEALLNANEQLRLAEGRYEAGVGNIIELGDAQVAQTSAAQQKVQAEYKLAAARAQLLRAIGRT